jgi:hypothetical protein
MQSAVMNFKTGVFSSRERLTVTVSGGTISADQLDITGGGHKVSFTGNIESSFDPPDPQEPPSQEPVEIR